MLNHEVSHDDLMRFLDDELPPDRRADVARHLDECTECRRDFVVFQSMKGALAHMLNVEPGTPSVWNRVNRRIMLPAAWVLLVAGALALGMWGAWTYITSPEDFWQKLFVGAIAVGLALLLISAIGDRLRELKTDPYTEIQR
jgi:anti-sigma factor RsiW